MNLILLEEFGPPDVLRLREAPDPAPRRGEVLIEVAFASVTFVETQFRAGHGPFQVELPMVPGNGVGGVVTAVGDGVDEALLGRTVISTTGGGGGYAEAVAVDADLPIPVPDGVSLDEAVALLADGRTANMLLDLTPPKTGERVLILAAGGGVGSLLVQLAAASGATVVAAAAGKRELLRALGANVIADYRVADWPATVRAAVGEVDLLLDGVGGELAAAAFGLVSPGGRMVSYGMASGDWANIPEQNAGQRGVRLLQPGPLAVHDAKRLSARALRQAAERRLRPVIGQRFPLADAAGAHRAIESRLTVGKTLLTTRSAG
ncbi:MAG TPA: zinc-binding dehydrogenase [Actinomycetales bacterium]|nr:zinc-binding dehydrogenase [Actinomycetales bacterium]